MEELNVANTIFALNFFKHLANTSANTQNIFFCPWSISSTVAMVYLGARGNTADQIAQVLQFNQVGVHEGTPVTPQSLTSCDFMQQIQRDTYPDAILQAQAAGKIHSSFRSLSNAINTSTGEYLLESANKLFGEKSARFKETQRKSVEMMFLNEKLNIGYIADLKVQILELPYAGNVSMFLLLPDEIAESSTGLELLESELTYDKLNKWLSEDTMAEDDVVVYIPEFKLEERYELKTILTSMGMGDAFSRGQANFSGMSGKNDLFLSEVFHQASVEVNKEGTEASAGTGAIMTGRTGHGGPQFVADHPFLFLIMHKITKSILFLGRFASP
ncbi:hypothetical protein G4228_016769 [Cervus hanglu yarkandensis]|nr:hypothetical protein G4228_016769 [Cervus hanglu yarkandensis]